MLETEEDKEEVALRALRQSEVTKIKSCYYSYLVSSNYKEKKKETKSIYDFDNVLQVTVRDFCKLYRLDPLANLEDKRWPCFRCCRVN